MKCPICCNLMKFQFSAQVLSKYEVKIYYCEKCNFLCTEKPYWQEEAYITPINITDTGIMKRSISLVKPIANLIYCFFDYRNTYLDYAGGYGIFTRLMRDMGFDFKWQDKYSQNLVSRGFEYSIEKDQNIELVTAFEVLEHLDNPVKEIEEILKISNNILFTTFVLPNPVPSQDSWWYYGFEHGQHISFYSKKTFCFIANKFGMNYYSDNKSLHLLTKKTINPWLFRLLVDKKTGYLFTLYLRQHLTSRTWSDYLEIKHRL